MPAPRAPTATTRAEVRRLGPWFHNLHLPDGTETAPRHPLGDFPAKKWRTLAPHLPARLDGWTVLDVGCNAGFYSFELARRGAQVTAIDLDARYLRQARWAARRFGLSGQIRFRRMWLYDLAREPARYDLVLFMGVFYHLRYPLLGLDLVAERVRRRLVFQSLRLPGGHGPARRRDLGLDERGRLLARDWPKLAFVEHRLAGDPTNWWVPNGPAIEAMLRSSGLRVLRRLGHEIYLCAPRPRRLTPLERLRRTELGRAAGRKGAPR